MYEPGKDNYADYLYGHLTRYFSKLLGTTIAPGQKIYFFTFLCSIVMAMILAASNYFFGLLFIILLFIFVPFLRSLFYLQKTKVEALHLLIFEAILLLGLIIHSWQQPFILSISSLALFGFLLIPHFSNESKTTFYTLSFELRMTLFILSLAVNLPILLLFFYALLFNSQIILKMVAFERDN
ncbi:MAG: hypothetical protein NTV32_08230 [Gammaproteobacteria bacterium]|jgi:hypothetical protein|nr:hypothetical protein [Gammaproteobacteria bacterium]